MTRGPPGGRFPGSIDQPRDLLFERPDPLPHRGDFQGRLAGAPVRAHREHKCATQEQEGNNQNHEETSGRSSEG